MGWYAAFKVHQSGIRVGYIMIVYRWAKVWYDIITKTFGLDNYLQLYIIKGASYESVNKVRLTYPKKHLVSFSHCVINWAVIGSVAFGNCVPSKILTASLAFENSAAITWKEEKGLLVKLVKNWPTVKIS